MVLGSHEKLEILYYLYQLYDLDSELTCVKGVVKVWCVNTYKFGFPGGLTEWDLKKTECAWLLWQRKWPDPERNYSNSSDVVDPINEELGKHTHVTSWQL